MWLHDKIEEKVEQTRERIRKIVAEHGDEKVGEVRVSHLFNGLRELDLLVSDVSYVDAAEGVHFRGFTVKEVLSQLPKADGSDFPLLGGMYYLLLVGEIPTRKEALAMEEEFRHRSDLPYHVADMIRAMPRDTHPMTMFSQAILALQSRSEFTLLYNNGLQKQDFWRPTLKDGLGLVAKTPTIAAAIFNIKYLDKDMVPPSQTLDWVANYAYMIRKDWDKQYIDLMRLFFVLHADQGTGNVSGHTGMLVNSSLSDIYFSCSAAINGLAGPLHGRANQDCLEWLLSIYRQFNGCPTEAQLEEYIWDTLNQGKVIPGYGHPVLRKTDPRFAAQLEFGRAHMADDELFQLVEMVYKVAPRVLTAHGKAKNPWPNIDAISGAMQYHCGIKEYDFYTVLFGVGRIMGITANIIWSRALFNSLERPQSITLDMLEEKLRVMA